MRNQLVSLGLIFVVGVLAVLSAVLTGASQDFTRVSVVRLILLVAPNKRLQPRHNIPVSIVVGLALELLKYVNLMTLPFVYRKFEHEYGPYKNSVTIVVWSFVASLIVLAGADWAARCGVPADHESPRARPARTGVLGITQS